LGLGGDAREVDLSGVELDQKQHIKRHQPAQCPHFRAEEVRGPQHVHVAADEFSPRRGRLALGSGGDTATFEDVAHGLIADVIAQLGQGPRDAIVSPAPILLGHADDPVFEFLVDSGPSR